MAAETAKEETPAPVTVAEGGRGSSEANDKNTTQNLQYGTAFFEQLQKAVSPERKPRTHHPLERPGQQAPANSRCVGLDQPVIHDVLGWINPSLRHMAQAVDQFADLRSAGLRSWINIVQGLGIKLETNWNQRL
jgi:hypothetical protein